jgi:phytoene synthase
VPPGTDRYWSWLFAARAARAPLLGMYALMAEWRALTDPGPDVGVAHLQLAWWRDEIARLAAGRAAHPITRYLADLPGAGTADFGLLADAVEAAAAQVAGAPLEHALELRAHAGALYGAPLLVAAQLGTSRPGAAPGDPGATHSMRACIAALACALYLARAIADYGREARCGRIPFAVDELLAAGIDNADLAAAAPPPRLAAYLEGLRTAAGGYFVQAGETLAPAERPELRHLAVLAALGSRHLHGRNHRRNADFRLADLYNAWNAARRAAAAR